MEDTVGLKASVYQQIPAGGIGKVNVTLKNGSLKELDAVSDDAELIESFKTVEVVEVVNSRTVKVKRI